MMINFLALIIIIAIQTLGTPSVGICSPARNSSSVSASREYKEARGAFSRGDLAGCQKSLFKNLFPKARVSGVVLEESAKLLGVCQYLSGNQTAAKKSFLLALSSNPSTSIHREDLLDPSLESFFQRLRPKPRAVAAPPPKAVPVRRTPPPQAPIAPKARTGILVKTNTERATVFDDGIFVGPANQFIELDPGQHNISVSAEGFLDSKYKFNLKNGQAAEITLTLRKPEKPKPPTPQKKPETQQKLNASASKNQEKGMGKNTNPQYNETLPGPKKGASLNDEFGAPPPQQTQARQNQTNQPQRQLSAAELLAPPSTPTPPQQQPQYPQQAQYPQQPIYAQQPIVIQQPPVFMPPPVTYTQPYYQPSYPPPAGYPPAGYPQQVPQYAAPQTESQYTSPPVPKAQSTRAVSSRARTQKASEKIHPAVAMLPLGIGQFAKGEPVKGIIFGGAQIGGVTWAVMSYMKEAAFTKAEQESLANDIEGDTTTFDDNYDPDQAKAYKNSQRMNQYIGIGIAGAAWIVSVIDGLNSGGTHAPPKRMGFESENTSPPMHIPAKETFPVRWTMFATESHVGLTLNISL
jgi:hypothetical protein